MAKMKFEKMTSPVTSTTLQNKVNSMIKAFNSQFPQAQGKLNSTSRGNTKYVRIGKTGSRYMAYPSKCHNLRNRIERALEKIKMDIVDLTTSVQLTKAYDPTSAKKSTTRKRRTKKKSSRKKKSTKRRSRRR